MKRKIAIVDDNLATLTITRQALHKDFDIIPLTSASQVLVFLESQTPDLILLDIEMPIIDGITCLKSIKKLKPTVPVIIVTGNGDNSKDLAVSSGASGYIKKPVVYTEMIEYINTLFENAAGSKK